MTLYTVTVQTSIGWLPYEYEAPSRYGAVRRHMEAHPEHKGKNVKCDHARKVPSLPLRRDLD